MTASTNDLEPIRALRTRLWEAGFRAVPIYNPVPGQKDSGKRPHGLGWQTAARANPPACTRLPASPSAINTGILCDGFRVIDIDIEDQSRAAEVEAIAVDMFGSCPVRFRANSGKRALFYRASEGEPSKLSITGEHGKIEILGKGQQFVAFGAHFTGAVLEWRGGEPGDFTAGDLPSVSEDEINRFLDAARSIVGAKEETAEKPISERASVSAARHHLGSDTRPRERAAFEKALEAECGLVASAGDGTRNDTLNKAAFNLSQMAAAGWGSPVEVNHALTDAARTCGLPAIEAAKTIRSGMEAGAQSPRPPLVDRRDERETLDPSPLINGHTGGALTVVQNDDDIDPDDDDDETDGTVAAFGDDLTHVPGILGELIDWISAVGSTGNRRLALATALPVMGTILGRRMATPTRGGGGLELYIIATMQSGGGKSDQIRAASQIMAKLGLDREHLTTAEFGSGRALGAHIAKKPLTLWVLDEAADYMERVFGPSSHFQEIVTILKKSWGWGYGTPFQSTESLSRPSEIVYAPSLSMCGFTTPDDLLRVIKTKEVTGGFINRFTIIDVGEKTRQEPDARLRTPPDKLLAGLRDLYQMGRSREGNMAGTHFKNGDMNPDPVIVPWASASAHDAWNTCDEECDRLKDELGVLGKIYGRTSFMAIKMATIRACGEHSPVTEEHVAWGYAIARNSADMLLASLRERMVDPITPAEFFQKIKLQFTNPTARGLEMMEQYGGNALPRKFLWENLKHHTGRNTFDFDNAVKAMASNGEIALQPLTNRRTRREVPCIIYRRRISRKVS